MDNLDGSDIGKHGVVGLLIEDSSASKMCMFAMLCRLGPPGGISIALPSVPRVIHARQSELWRRAREPLVGELMHFARGLPGGVPLRRNDLANQVGCPTVVVTKKIISNDWVDALRKSRAWMEGAGAVFSRIVEGSQVAEERFARLPGDVGDPELAQFARFAAGLASDLARKRDSQPDFGLAQAPGRVVCPATGRMPR